MSVCRIQIYYTENCKECNVFSPQNVRKRDRLWYTLSKCGGGVPNGLKTLGITDLFDPECSDYSPLTKKNTDPIALSEALHGTRVTIDKEGCTVLPYGEDSFLSYFFSNKNKC